MPRTKVCFCDRWSIHGSYGDAELGASFVKAAYARNSGLAVGADLLAPPAIPPTALSSCSASLMLVPFGLVATFDPGVTLFQRCIPPQINGPQNWIPASETNFTFSVVSPVGTTLLVLRQRMRIADIWICAPDVFCPRAM